jgi:nitrite reductase (NADH) large subunit
METSEKDIFGAGDVIEHRERLYGIWPAAEEQGRVAGINMAGGTAIYKGSTPSNLLKVAGVDLMAAGDIDADNKYEAVRFRDEENFIYKKLVFKEGILSGFILYGELKETAVLMNALKEGWNKEKVKEQIIKK